MKQKLRRIVLVMEPGRLLVAGLGRALRGWRILRRQEIALAEADSLAEALIAALKPVSVTWGLAPDTPALLILPPHMGGWLELHPGRPVARKDREAIADGEIARLLPYPPRELSRAVVDSAGTGSGFSMSLLWLHRSQVNELSMALARMGLSLLEIFQRGQLLVPRAEASGVSGLLERVGDDVYIHVHHEDGRLMRSRRLGGTGEDWADELGMELLSLEADDARPELLELRDIEADALSHRFGELKLRQRNDDADLMAALLRFQAGGGEGLWFAPESGRAMAQLIPLIIGVATIGLLAVFAVWWQNQSLATEVDGLEERYDALERPWREAVAVEARVVDLVERIRGIEELERPPQVQPLQALYDVFKVLPGTVWLTRFQYWDGGVRLEGYGGNSADVVGLLAGNARFGNIRPVDAVLATDAARHPFAVEATWTLDPPQPAATAPAPAPEGAQP